MKLFITIILAFFISCTGQEKNSRIIIEEAFPNLTFEQPVDIQSPDDGTNRLFVLSQPGVIYVFDNDKDVKEKKSSWISEMKYCLEANRACWD